MADQLRRILPLAGRIMPAVVLTVVVSPAPDFYIRCEKVRCGMMEKADMQGQRRGNAPRRLLVLLNRLHPPPKSLGSIQSDAEALLESMEWFDRTRRVLRYRNGPIPLSTKHTLSDTELEKGRRRLD